MYCLKTTALVFLFNLAKIHDALSLVNLYFAAEVCIRCDNAAFARFVAEISRTSSNGFEFVRLIAATKFCRSDQFKIVAEMHHVTRGNMLQQLVAASCRLVFPNYTS